MKRNDNDSLGRWLRAGDPGASKELKASQRAAMRVEIRRAKAAARVSTPAYIGRAVLAACSVLICVMGLVALRSGQEPADDGVLTASVGGGQQKQAELTQIRLTTPGGMQVLWTIRRDTEGTDAH